MITNPYVFYLYFRNGSFVRIDTGVEDEMLPSVANQYFDYLVFSMPADVEVEMMHRRKLIRREYGRADRQGGDHDRRKT